MKHACITAALAALAFAAVPVAVHAQDEPEEAARSQARDWAGLAPSSGSTSASR